MSRRRFPLAATVILCLLALGVSGCHSYRFTYADAFPPEPIDFPRWDPPDSLAFMLPEPPPVEAVILDANYYYLLHPPGEADFHRQARERAARERRRRRVEAEAVAAATAIGVSAMMDADSTRTSADDAGLDSLVAAADSLSQGAPPDTVPFVAPPPVQVDLSEREKDVYRRRAMVDLERAESLVVLLDAIEEPTRRQTDTVQSVRGFVQRALDALDREDYLGASNLALKARTLAEDAYEGHP